MSWRCARGFVAGRLPVGPDDVSRIGSHDRGTAIAIANASAEAFELCAPALSRAMLDAAIAAWERGASAADAIDAAARVLGGGALGWMLFGSLASEVEIAWVGLDEARQLVGTTIVTRTMPHSLGATHGPGSPDVSTRSLGGDPVTADTVTWQPRAGSRLVFASHSVARVDVSTAVGAAGVADMQSAADQLADAAVQEHGGRFAVVVIAERG